MGDNDLGFNLLLNTSGPDSTRSTLCLGRCVGSPSVLITLSGRLGFHRTFDRDKLSFLGRLDGSRATRNFLGCCGSHVGISCSSGAKLLGVRARNFDPRFTLGFGRAILGRSRHFVGRVSRHVTHSRLTFTRARVRGTHRHLSTDGTRLLSCRSGGGILSPRTRTRTTDALIGALVNRGVRVRTSLQGLLACLHRSTPRIIDTHGTVRSLRTRVSRRGDGVATPRNSGLGHVTISFRRVGSGMRFGARLCGLALASVRGAHMRTTHGLGILSIVDSPRLPRRSSFPGVPCLVTY